MSDDDEIPEPCTDAAMLAGCTCRMSAVHSASIDPPEPVLDIGCPVHGKYRPGGVDADDERDRRIEDLEDACNDAADTWHDEMARRRIR